MWLDISANVFFIISWLWEITLQNSLFYQSTVVVFIDALLFLLCIEFSNLARNPHEKWKLVGIGRFYDFVKPDSSGFQKWYHSTILDWWNINVLWFFHYIISGGQLTTSVGFEFTNLRFFIFIFLYFSILPLFHANGRWKLLN